MSIFDEGSAPSLEEVLQTRENRSSFQEKLCQKYPVGTLISFKCNIPGPVKNNAIIKQLFEIGKNDIRTSLSINEIPIVYFKELDLNTGPECFFMTQKFPIKIKHLMIKLENQTILGRLFDNDVLYNDEGEVKSVSRTQLGYPLRQCLVCSNTAKGCGRNRTHKLEDIYSEIEGIVKRDTRFLI